MKELKLLKYKKLVNSYRLLPDTIVNLTYSVYNGKGGIRKSRKTYKVIKDYGYHVLLVDVNNNTKLDITKSDIFTRDVQLEIVQTEQIAINY